MVMVTYAACSMQFEFVDLFHIEAKEELRTSNDRKRNRDRTDISELDLDRRKIWCFEHIF